MRRTGRALRYPSDLTDGEWWALNAKLIPPAKHGGASSPPAAMPAPSSPLRTGCWRVEIVKRANLHRFVVLPKRWIVERSFAWISRNRRLTRDFERHARTVVAVIRLAMIRPILRRLAAHSN